MRAPENIWIAGVAGRIEALARRAKSPTAIALIAHPHPKYGGSMHNPVVYYVDRELSRRGMTTLRFNFRGVGESEGEHGANFEEVQDLEAATDWMRMTHPSAALILVGYSFGSICCLRQAAVDPEVSALVAIGLPVRLYELPELAALSQPLLVVQGSRDELGSPAAVRGALAPMTEPVEVRVLEGAEHIFHGRAKEVADLVGAGLESLVPEYATP